MRNSMRLQYVNGSISEKNGRLMSKRVTEMSDREYAIFKRRRQASFRRKNFMLSLMIITAFIIFLLLLIKGISSNAAGYDASGKCKYYKTEMIRFDKGVSEIAADNFDPDHYGSVDELKKEILEINHIDQDSAIPGGMIIYVPYYGDIH